MKQRYAPRRHTATATAKERFLEGVLRLTRQGYGFFAPDRPETDPARSGVGESPDVKIDEYHLGGAFHGDRVRVRLYHERPGREERPRGEVVAVLARNHDRFVAVTVEEDIVRPEDERNPYDYRIRPEDLAQPIRAGWKVLVEPVEWPGSPDDGGDGLKDGEAPLVRLVEVLGPAGEAGTETAAILAALGIETGFPEDALTAARALPQSLPPAERARRLDLTGLTTVTIDPPDARDFDDALSLEFLPDGVRRVGVHIADVSLAVAAGSVLDETARDRGVSVYLPDRAIPMLPEEVANNLCSLRPLEDRAAKTVFIDFDADGQRLGYEIHRSVIRSARRFTYEEVRDLLDPDHVRAPLPGAGESSGAERPVAPTAEVLAAAVAVTARPTSRSGRLTAVSDKTAAGSSPADPAADARLLPVLRGLDELAQTLRRNRRVEGAVELNLYEIRVRIDATGRVTGIEKESQDFSHQLVEEFMLSANRVLGEWAVTVGAGVLHRVHEAPSPERFGELCEYLAAIGLVLKPPPDRRRINALLERVRGTPGERGVNMAVLRAFSQAHYAPDASIGHFALAFPRYVHFTSPIRRYPDLQLHQTLDAHFPPGGHRLPKRAGAAAAVAAAAAASKNPESPKDATADGNDGAALLRLGIHCSERERRAMKAEMEAAEFRRLEWLAENALGATLNAVVTGVKKFGVFVELEGYYVEGLLPKAMVEAAGFVLREEPPPHPSASVRAENVRPARLTGKARRLAGSRGFWLGQVVRVRVESVDFADRRCRLELRTRG